MKSYLSWFCALAVPVTTLIHSGLRINGPQLKNCGRKSARVQLVPLLGMQVTEIREKGS